MLTNYEIIDDSAVNVWDIYEKKYVEMAGYISGDDFRSLDISRYRKRERD